MFSGRSKYLAGFTLIEVVVALTVFSIGILGVVVSISMGTQASTASMRRADAARLAQNQMELASQVSRPGLGSLAGVAGIFTWERSFVPQSDSLYIAKIIVKWEGRGGVEQFELNELMLIRESE